MMIKSLHLFILTTIPFMSYGQAPQILSLAPLETMVAKYGKYELRVDISAQYDNPYDYREIAIEALFNGPGGQQLAVDGFYAEELSLDPETGDLMSSGNGGVFKVRFSPAAVGTWTYQIHVRDQSGTATSEVQTFQCTNSDHPGFIRSNLTNYLHFDNGEQYLPIGENMAWQNNDPFLDYTSWLTALSDNGGNFIRLWQAHWGLGIEWKNGSNDFAGLRRYKESNMAYQDWLFDFCAEKGVYLMLCLQHHGQVSTQVDPNWQDSPYNAANGGPCQNTWDFFTNNEARDHTKNRLRYIVARWGYARSLMAWELFNEVGWTDNYNEHREEIAEWQAEMAAYLKSIDPYQHLVTTSFADETQDPMVWANPDIDFTQTHFYLNTTNLQNALVNGITSYLDEFGKPTLTGEFGLGASSDLSNADADGIHLHNAMWATLFGGGLGTGMSWWWDHYIHPRDLYYHFAPLSVMKDKIPFLEEDLRPASSYVSGVSGDLVLTPTLGWGGIGEDTLHINAKGVLEPAAADLGIYLYGSSFNTEFRSPPTFIVGFPEAGTFTVKTNLEKGFNPRIAITIDGVPVVEQSADINKTYTLPLEAGPHTITVDNTGADWITIASYTFSGIGSQVDAYVLTADDRAKAAGWVLNRAYNHQDVVSLGLPDPAIGGILEVAGFQSGGYTVYWFDCLSGMVNSTETVFAEDGILEILIPPLYWDLAFWIESEPLAVRKPEASPAFNLYPNPLRAGDAMTVQWAKGRVGERTRLSLFDASGKPVSVLGNQAGQAQLQWRIPADLPAGIYWVQVQQGKRMGSRPVVVGE